jgi:hypothetical protein
MHEDAFHSAGGIDQWLVDKVNYEFLQGAAGLALHAHRQFRTYKGLARFEDAVQQFEKALTLDFRKRITHCPADQLAMAHQLAVRWVGHLEYVVATA